MEPKLTFQKTEKYSDRKLIPSLTAEQASDCLDRWTKPQILVKKDFDFVRTSLVYVPVYMLDFDMSGEYKAGLSNDMPAESLDTSSTRSSATIEKWVGGPLHDLAPAGIRNFPVSATGGFSYSSVITAEEEPVTGTETVVGAERDVSELFSLTNLSLHLGRLAAAKYHYNYAVSFYYHHLHSLDISYRRVLAPFYRAAVPAGGRDDELLIDAVTGGVHGCLPIDNRAFLKAGLVTLAICLLIAVFSRAVGLTLLFLGGVTLAALYLLAKRQQNQVKKTLGAQNSAAPK